MPSENLFPNPSFCFISRSCSAINTSHDADKSYFITTKHRALNGLGQRMTPGPTRNGDGEEDLVVTLILVVKPRSVIEACYLDVTDGQAKGEEPLDLFSDIKAVKPHPDPSEWDPSRSYPFPLAGDSAHLCSQVSSFFFLTSRQRQFRSAIFSEVPRSSFDA